MCDVDLVNLQHKPNTTTKEPGLTLGVAFIVKVNLAPSYFAFADYVHQRENNHNSRALFIPEGFVPSPPPPPHTKICEYLSLSIKLSYYHGMVFSYNLCISSHTSFRSSMDDLYYPINARAG